MSTARSTVVRCRRDEKRVLGEGAFAKVRLATSESTGHAVAVKIIKRKKLNQRTEELLQREVKHHEKQYQAAIAAADQKKTADQQLKPAEKGAAAPASIAWRETTALAKGAAAPAAPLSPIAAIAATISSIYLWLRSINQHL